MMIVASAAAGGQEMRRAGPDDRTNPPTPGVARDPNFPYAGIWTGSRTLLENADEIRIRIDVVDGEYKADIRPAFAKDARPNFPVTTTAGGVTFQHANSGGGIWVYHIRLVGPDSVVGTVELTQAPAVFNPVPKGTIAVHRVAAASSAPRSSP